VYLSCGRFRGDNAICVFKLGEDGNLSLVQELVNGTAELRGYLGGNEILVSRDGRNVYAVASRSNSLASFQRDRESGKLTQMQALIHETEGVGPLQIVSGLAISPDGKYVYAAAEGDGAISIFERHLPAK
jgi:6-phosphogluconolactonase (cycloisomerase 2 family)